MALSKLFKSPTIPEHLATERKKFNLTANPQLHEVPDPYALEIGTLEDVDAESYQHDTGIFTTGNRVFLHSKLPYTHLVGIGEPGSGKSTGTLTVCNQLIRDPNVDLVVIDGA